MVAAYQNGKVNKVNNVVPPETATRLVESAKQAITDVKVNNAVRNLVANLYDENWIERPVTKEKIKRGVTLARVCEVLAVYNLVSSQLRYTKDPYGVELVYHPKFLHTYAFSRNRKFAEDCDSIAGLTLTYLLALGHRCRITIVGYPYASGYSHVFAESLVEGIGWIVVDPALGLKVPGMVKNIVRFKHFYP